MRLRQAFTVGAVCDAIVLVPLLALSIQARGWAIFYMPHVLLWSIWTALAVRGARSRAVALDAARFYAVTHAVSAVLLGVWWLVDVDDGILGGMTLSTFVAGAAVHAAARSATRPTGAWTWTSLQQAGAAELQSLLRRRAGPSPDALLGRRYRTLTLSGPGPRTAHRSFFHAPHGPPVEGVERADGHPDAWFLVEAGTGGTHLDWRRSRRNSGAERRRSRLEVVVCVDGAAPGLLRGRRVRRLGSAGFGVGWFLLEDVGAAEGT